MCKRCELVLFNPFEAPADLWFLDLVLLWSLDHMPWSEDFSKSPSTRSRDRWFSHETFLSSLTLFAGPFNYHRLVILRPWFLRLWNGSKNISFIFLHISICISHHQPLLSKKSIALTIFRKNRISVVYDVETWLNIQNVEFDCLRCWRDKNLRAYDTWEN